MAKKKGIKIKNTSKGNRHGTNCNDNSRVIVGRSSSDSIPYSMTVQKSVSHYIMQYDLKCSILQFPMRAPWYKLVKDNKLSNEFLDVFAPRVNWSMACRHQKLSESLMDKHSHLIDWAQASYYQEFSKKFILRHLDDLSMDIIINHRYLITQEEVDEFKKNEEEKKKFLENGEEIEDRFDILDM